MAKQPNAPDAAPAAPNTSGADAVWKKTITAWKDWIVQFFQELLETRIDFWAPPQSSLAGDALLSVCCVALFYLARTTHADFSSAPGAPIATAAVAISAIILACIACAVDTESRKTFVQSVNDCYRVLIVAAILSAAFIGTGHVWDWGQRLDSLLGLTGSDDTTKQIVARSAIAAVVAFGIIGLNSLSKPPAAAKPQNAASLAVARSSARIVLWSVYFLISFWILNFVMFFAKSN